MHTVLSGVQSSICYEIMEQFRSVHQGKDIQGKFPLSAAWVPAVFRYSGKKMPQPFILVVLVCSISQAPAWSYLGGIVLIQDAATFLHWDPQQIQSVLLSTGKVCYSFVHSLFISGRHSLCKSVEAKKCTPPTLLISLTNHYVKTKFLQKAAILHNVTVSLPIWATHSFHLLGISYFHLTNGNEGCSVRTDHEHISVTLGNHPWLISGECNTH